MNTLKAGDKAPLFSLYNSDKKEVKLEELRGKNVVLLFFPFAFTGTCTTELCSVRDDIANYQKMNAEVLAISVDSVFSLDRFKEDQNLNMQLVSDFNKEASTAYGSIYETFGMGYKGVSKRSAFVIDAEGTIQYAEVLENASEIPDLEKVKEVLAGLGSAAK